MIHFNPKKIFQDIFVYLLQWLQLVCVLPLYTGAYPVGTLDAEVPVEDLESPAPQPHEAKGISTVRFRIFYPAKHDTKKAYADTSTASLVSWFSEPKREQIRAYLRYAGVWEFLSRLISAILDAVIVCTMNATNAADMASSKTGQERWPVMVFIHGLAANRNTYSFLVSSLASHGMVVVCPEHRDGSAILSSIMSLGAASIIPYKELPYFENAEFYSARESQFKIRFWELGLIHDAIVKMDVGVGFHNIAACTDDLLFQFRHRLDIRRPGSIIFAGHSFGAATTYQFVKSVYHADSLGHIGRNDAPFYLPDQDSAIRRQITDSTIMLLLDMWALPLLGSQSVPLANLPAPMYCRNGVAKGNANKILAIGSAQYHVWTKNLRAIAGLISPLATVLHDKEAGDGLVSFTDKWHWQRPRFLYVRDSMHMSQSDMLLLFPWMRKKQFTKTSPVKVLHQSIEAILSMLRENNVPIHVPVPTGKNHPVVAGIVERQETLLIDCWPIVCRATEAGEKC